MEMLVRNPKDGIYPATDDYVHGMEVRGAGRLLFVSGTMGLDATGAAPPDLKEQLDLVWSNIRRILQEADMTTANIVRLTSSARLWPFCSQTKPLFINGLAQERVLAWGF